ncbi:DUF4232 domain-containing protein [Streptomyces actuosus]|uniref:DUF4232 domain-containing protein n=1 Tax=Streptomyces actuosus TaxID=1885 RepID=A0ABS2VS38_STRAS|nr:DUF4232 domain-containing protein [Streptomyces actuosus]MBN0045891.1 DUF4232 domain-containing protein [Streptomyces actuosus]
MRTTPLALASVLAGLVTLTGCGTERISAHDGSGGHCTAASPSAPGGTERPRGGVRITGVPGAPGGDCVPAGAVAVYEVTNDSAVAMAYTIIFGLRPGTGGGTEPVTLTVDQVRPGETVRRTLGPEGLPPGASRATSAEVVEERSVPVAELPSSGGPCPSGGVRVHADRGDAAMGLRVVGLHLENCGTAVYRLDGYPELELFDEDHDPVDGVRILHGGEQIASGTGADGPPTALALKPGERASAVLVWRNTTEFGDPVDAPYVRVRARPDARPVTVTPELDLGTTGRLGVGPWKRDDDER